MRINRRPPQIDQKPAMAMPPLGTSTTQVITPDTEEPIMIHYPTLVQRRT